MKRDIKFKGKRLDNVEWIYGMPTYDFEYIFNGEQLDSYDNYEVTPETVSQFTGLKDKNGVEIYEGDIFRYHAHRGYTLPDFTGHVIFENGSFGFVIDQPFNGETIKYFSDIDELKEDFLYHIEVIGNIHDKNKQKQALIDMMRGDEEIGLYDDNSKNHGYEG